MKTKTILGLYSPAKVIIILIKYLQKSLVILGVIFFQISGFTQVGVQTENPDPSSVLDVVSPDKGILVPRLTLSSELSNPSPVNNPATGLLIFNSGPNHPIGFYFWNGSEWEGLGGSTEIPEAWLIDGNEGLAAGSNYLGTTDSVDLVIRTVAAERMRVNDQGQVIIGTDAAGNDADLFAVVADSIHNSGINSYSDYIGIYSSGTKYALIAFSSDSTGFPVYAKNENVDGYGGMFVGSDGTAYTLIGRSAGITSHGNDGVFTTGIDQDEGIGVIAGGNNVQVLSTINTGAGGAFTGFHGLYSHAIDTDEGVGVIGVGNDYENYLTLRDGSGGAFTGYHGLFGYAVDEDNGAGVVGAGNGAGYYMMPDGLGCGAAFTGKYIGIAAWADDNDDNSIGVLGQYYGFGAWDDGVGVYGVAYANSNRGYGVYGAGNRYGVFANGNFGATGSKSFVIDHPLDPENKMLKHYSVESPEVLNMYRGNVILDQNGENTIILPDYFTTINTNFSYVLTPVGASAPGLYIKSEINQEGKFVVAGGEPGLKVSWVVYAERNDPFLQSHPESKAVEVEKKDANKGKYLRPELFGKKAEQGIFYQEKQEKQKANMNKVNRVKATQAKEAAKRK